MGVDHFRALRVGRAEPHPYGIERPATCPCRPLGAARPAIPAGSAGRDPNPAPSAPPHLDEATDNDLPRFLRERPAVASQAAGHPDLWLNPIQAIILAFIVSAPPIAFGAWLLLRSR